MQVFINNNVRFAQEKIKNEEYIDNYFEKSKSDSDSNEETESDIDE